jgi:hypothetical protein
MSTITLEYIKAEQARLELLIAQFDASAPEILIFPEVRIDLRPGEHYVGVVLDADGPSHHLILLPGEAEDVTWQDAKAWATKADGELPTRQEQALLYANCKAQFQGTWYWSAEEHTDSSYAWLQNFHLGYQSGDRKSYEGRARAVRRFTA